MNIHYIPDYFLNPTHPITLSLIGCGGTGSQMLTCLARIHVALKALGHAGLFVTCYDPDEVSSANIGRQAFSSSDIGQNKATILVSRINRYFGLNWESCTDPFDRETLALNRERRVGTNIMITCVDTGRMRKKIFNLFSELEFHYDYERPYYSLDIGNSKSSAQAVLGTLCSIKQPDSNHKTVSDLPTILDLYPDIENFDDPVEQGPSCSVFESLSRQDLFINSIIAQLGADLLWKMFREVGLQYHGVFLNLETFKSNPLPVKTEFSEMRKGA